TTLDGGGVFVTKFDRNGARVYSTYLRTGNEPHIAVDAAQNAYIAGGGDGVFVAKLNFDGSDLVYSTDLGAGEEVSGIAVDTVGNAYVTGVTGAGFPTTTGAFQTAFGGGDNDAFVTKLNPTGSALVYSTYLGGSGADGGRGIAVDGSGNAYVTGFTRSSNFPTTGAAFQPFGGDLDAFVTMLNASGSALIYSTYLGGSRSDGGRGRALDGSDNAYITGFTASSDFPTTPEAFDTTYNGDPEDAIVAKIVTNTSRGSDVVVDAGNGVSVVFAQVGSA